VLPDRRTGKNLKYSMADIGMAAFSVFFMQSPSFLSHQRALAARRGRSNAETLFSLSAIPCDNHIREMLDGVPSDHFDGLFHDIVDRVERAEGLGPWRVLDGHVLIALDGTEHHRSSKIRCAQCSTQTHANGTVDYHHRMLGVSIVAPGHKRVLPLPSEFLVPQDGHDKQDSEIAAAARWLNHHGPRLSRLRPVYLGDDLFAHQPSCQQVLDAGADFLFTAKPQSHKILGEYLHGVTLDSLTRTVKRGKTRALYHYRWMSGVPLRDGADALAVNWLEIAITNAEGKLTYRNSFVTSLPVGPDTVEELAACARARWKIENETFNVLKNGGYHLEHNFGHGKETLCQVLVALNLLAFAMHEAAATLSNAWIAARAALSTKHRFFENLRTVTNYFIFDSWSQLLHTIATGDHPLIQSTAPP